MLSKTCFLQYYMAYQKGSIIKIMNNGIKGYFSREIKSAFDWLYKKIGTVILLREIEV